jgi:hypothetical protein
MLLKSYLAITLGFIITSIQAAPWVEPNDLALRNDIQLLADTGIIKAPVTTYPLMWNAIKNDLLLTNITHLTKQQRQAYNHVLHSFKYASTKPNITKKSIYLATDNEPLTSFGSDHFDQGNIELSDEFFIGNLAGKLQVNYRLGLDDDSQVNLGNDFTVDGSYLAYKLGNWIVTAGAIERWWGPGIDTSLIMSTNARPLPALSITRDNSMAFDTKWLHWIGPWTLTAQMAKLESDRAVPDALMWSSRATFRPFRGLEVGAAWSFQWAGEGQPNSIKDFFDVLAGRKECANGNDSCDASNNTFQGNHLAGYDIRWSDLLFNMPYALYYQTIGEDGSPNAGIITDKATLAGIETRFTLFQYRILANIELTDTQVACGSSGTTALNCFYEHGTYQSGYRYYRRNIGSTYDNDAQTLTATFLIQTPTSNSWQLKMRSAQLNTDNIDRFPDNINKGNSVSKVAKDLLQFDGQYKFIALDSRFTLGIRINHYKYDKNLITTDNVNTETNDDTNFDAYAKWEYRF